MPFRPPLLLELDLTAPLLTSEPDDPLGRLRARRSVRLRTVVRTLHEAGDDRRVAGLVAKVAPGRAGWATMQELRAGVLAFAASGKPTVAWAESFGEGGNGTRDYVLATAFGEVWLQPSGELSLLGVSAETTFVRGTLDRLGIEPQIAQRYEYKNAADRITRTEFTPEHREAVDRLAESVWTDAVGLIATGRRRDAADIRQVADTAPLSAADAEAAGLIDRLGYRDEVYASVRAQVGADAQLLFADRWSPSRPVRTRLPGRRDAIALIEGSGPIVSGPGRGSLTGGQLASDKVAASLRAARDADDVRAVVFRVDSPGGSAVASDTIWREVCLTREAGKPVVVSMGELAASGGYYVSCPADVIVAEPATLTGSIGVVGGKAVVAGLFDRVGLTTDAVSYGRHARMYSGRVGFTDDERERLDAMLDAIYDLFVDRVAQGRRMSRDAVHEVARGRVWTGADAAKRGLVDELGGLRDAVRIARRHAGLPATAPIRRPGHVPVVRRLRRPRSSEDPRAASLASSGWGELSGVAAAFGLPAAGPLLMPPVSLR